MWKQREMCETCHDQLNLMEICNPSRPLSKPFYIYFTQRYTLEWLFAKCLRFTHTFYCFVLFTSEQSFRINDLNQRISSNKHSNGMLKSDIRLNERHNTILIIKRLHSWLNVIKIDIKSYFILFIGNCQIIPDMSFFPAINAQELIRKAQNFAHSN